MLQDTEGGEARWLLLLHQLPARPSSLRVRVWRRLLAIGAVPLRGAAYALPDRPEPREDLAWVASDVKALGGQATVVTASLLDRADEAALEAAFRGARAPDYRALATAAKRLLASLERSGTDPAELGRAEARLRQEWDRLARITFFDPPERKEARDMLEKLRGRLSQSAGEAATRPRAAGTGRSGAYRGRTWLTRPRPGIDRMASAWLIRSHIDPRARFAFGDRARAGTIPYDMYEGEFSHQQGACTYEVLARRFGVRDPAVQWLGRVVHDVDLRDDRYGEPEAAGIALLVEGLRARHADDRELLEAGIALMAALARGREASGGRAKGAARRRTRSRKRRGSGPPRAPRVRGR